MRRRLRLPPRAFLTSSHIQCFGRDLQSLTGIFVRQALLVTIFVGDCDETADSEVYNCSNHDCHWIE